MRVRWEAEVFVWKLSDSYYQHAVLHQVDTNALVIHGVSLGVCVDGVMYVIRRMFAFFRL